MKATRALWHEEDGVFRCCQCHWEIVDFICTHCGEEYYSDMVRHFGLTLNLSIRFSYQVQDLDEDHHDMQIVVTDNEGLRSERRTAPRGTTPLDEVDSDDIPNEYLPDRSEEYIELLARGATRDMCTMFSLSFEPARGILARLRPGDYLWEEFAIPMREESEVWIICLGRRLALEEGDWDGEWFVEDLLDEVLYFPICGKGGGFEKIEQWKWETVKEEGSWITRPVMASTSSENEDNADAESREGSDEAMDQTTMEQASEADGSDKSRSEDDRSSTMEGLSGQVETDGLIRPDSYDTHCDYYGWLYSDDSDVDLEEPGLVFTEADAAYDPHAEDTPDTEPSTSESSETSSNGFYGY